MAKTDQKLNLLDSLIANKAVQINVVAKDWQEAIAVAVAPLVKAKAVEERYVEAIIAATIKFGPYYIISDKVAMPHARPEDGVNKTAFSLVILKKPVYFDNDKRAIRILITLAAASAAIHVGVALPQVVASFENDAVIQRLLAAPTSAAVLAILKEIDYSKYLK